MEDWWDGAGAMPNGQEDITDFQATAMDLSIPCKADLENRSSHGGTIAPAVPFAAIVPSLHIHAMDVAGQKSYTSQCTCREAE